MAVRPRFPPSSFCYFRFLLIPTINVEGGRWRGTEWFLFLFLVVFVACISVLVRVLPGSVWLPSWWRRGIELDFSDFSVYCPILSVCVLYFAFLLLVSLYNYWDYEAIQCLTHLVHRCTPFYLPKTRRCHPGGQSRSSGCAGLPPPFHPPYPFPSIHTFPQGLPELWPSSRARLGAAGRAESFPSPAKGIGDEKWLREHFSNNLVGETCLLLFLGLLHFAWERAAAARIRFLNIGFLLKFPISLAKGILESRLLGEEVIIFACPSSPHFSDAFRVSELAVSSPSSVLRIQRYLHLRLWMEFRLLLHLENAVFS